MAVLPAELEYVPDHSLHQLEGLLDLGLNQRGEVHDSHVYLHTQEHTHTHTQREEQQGLKPHSYERTHGNVEKYSVKEEEAVVRRKENTKRGEKCWRERLPDKWWERYKEERERERERGINRLGQKKEERLKNKMTQHGWLVSWFQLPQ